MKKSLLAALLMLMSVATYAAKEDLYVLHATFEESTALPEGWTTESVFGAQDWIVEQGDLTYPNKAAEGVGRVALRNTTTQTQGFITRLISPEMDLTTLTVQPMLIFSHAQAQRLGDVDVLKVYYRTSPQARWIQLAEYDEKITNWRADTIYLDAYNSKTYQIAFEGTDRFGRGIVLDDIIVRPDITCEDARDIRARSMSGTEAIIEWGGSLDTDSFEVVVSKKLYTSIEEVDWADTAIIYHKFVYDFSASLEKLDINTKYYIYIKAYCPTLEGQWVGAEIKTLNKVTLPFVEHFDAPYNKDNPAQAPNWTYGTSMRESDGVTMRSIPYLTNYRTESMWKNYSPNATPALEFAGAINAKVIPAGEYAYAASPEIDIDRIQDAYVDFWGTPYLYDREYSATEHYASGIIVGVMDNPADYSTFVPVDTCYAINKYKFDFFRVKFDKYTGNGKYIAFAADFDEQLLFFVDEVTVGSLKELARPVDIKVKDFTPTTVVVEPALINATAWNLIVSDVKTDEVDKLKPANILFKGENIPASVKDTLVTLTNMEGKWIRVYVQAVNGEDKSEWSYAQKYMMPNSLSSAALPKVYDFEAKPTYSYEEIWDYTSQTPGTLGYLVDGIISHVFHYADGYRNGSTETNAHGGSYSYHLNKRNSFSPYAVFPQLDSVQNKLFTFFYKDGSSSNSSQPYYQVGVMTDPHDTTTFEPVQTYSDAEYSVWKKAEVTFFDYKGEGRYIAIRLVDGPNTIPGKLAYGNIDDVTISAFDDCIKPFNVEATATNTSITIKWDANGMPEWEVVVSENWEDETKYIRKTVNTNEAVIEGLDPHTRYTYQITTIVGAKTSASDIFTIKTDCNPYELIPYKEGFEYTENSYSDPNPNGPNCWTMPLHIDKSSSSTYYFPYVTTSNAHSGNQKLNFGRHFGTSGSSLDSCYAALPMFDKDLKGLQLSFYIRGLTAYEDDTLYVGVMSDPNDIATFDTVYTFTVSGMVYKEHIVNLSSYAGQGKYIAFYKPVTSHYYMIDDVEVKELPDCEKVFNVKVKNIKSNGATFSWYKKDASKWQFVVATKDGLTASQIADKDASIVLDSIVEVNPLELADDRIAANVQHYAYIRAVCGEGVYGEWSSPLGFKTICTARDIDGFAANGEKAEKFSGSDDGCWKFGDRVGSGTHNILNGHIQLINSSANTDGAYAIAPQLAYDSLQKLQVTFDAWCAPSTSYNMCEVTVGVITNPEDLSTFVPVSHVKAQWDDDAADHEAYTVRFNEYEGDSNEDYGQFVMFISESGENSNKIEFTNIYFDEISAYPEPLFITADSIGSNGMKIRWENTKADSYEYRYADKLADLGSAAAIVISADSAELTDLTMLKTYYVQVRAKYGENYSAWSNWRKFTTECPAIRPIPFSENFDSYSSASSKNAPQCWGAFGSDGTVGADCITPTVYSSAKKDGKNGLYIGGSKTVASYTVLPRLDADLSNAILAFDYKHYSYSYADSLWIGVAGNAENLDSILNTVIWVDSIHEKPASSAANVWKEYKRKLAEAVNGEQYIVLKCKANYATYTTTTKYGFYIDNMSVEPDATCKKPEAPVAIARELNALGFSWTDTIASAWDVIAVAKGDDAPAMDATPAAIVDTTYALVGGLNPKTEYDLYVRANCGGGDVSFWVGPVTMKTLSMAAYPFFTDFEAEPTELTPGNSTSYKIHEGWISGLGKGTGASYYPYAKQDPTAATAKYANSYRHDANHTRALYFQANGTNDSAYIVLPVLYDEEAQSAVDLNTVQVRFQARKMSSGINAVDKKIPNFLPTGAIVTGDPSSRHQKVSNTRVINVGTVSNPADIKTFELIDAFELAPVLSVKDTFSTDDDPRGNDWWEEITVPMAGAKGKYVAIMYSASASNDFYIDNLYVEQASGIYAPNAVKEVGNSLNSVTVTWKNRFNAPKIDVAYVEAGGALADLTIAATTDKDTFEITGLQSNKQYDVYVRANYGEDKVSNWSAGTICATRYEVEQADAYWDFSRENNYVSPTTGNLLPLGWKVGSKNATSSSYIPKLQFNAVNTTTLAVTTAYSRQKVARNGALYIQSYVASSNNSDGAYAIMPAIKGNLEDKELHFWARVCAMTISNGAATSATSGTYATAAYPRAIKVGYVTDPDKIETFVELADIQLPALSTTTAKATEDASGNEFWNEIFVPLKGIGEGKYITFLSEYGAINNVWIDQIGLRDAGSICYTPNRLTVDSVGAHAAKFSWQLGEGEWAILLSTTKNEAHVVYDTVSTREYTNDTLLANTPYIFKVKKICGENVESKEVSVEFTTNCDPYDKEKATWSFSDKLVDQKAGTSTIKIPECWISGLGNGTSYTYFPQAAPNTASVILAKEETKTTSDRALQFYTTTSNYNSYAVLPPLDVNRDSTLLHFFGRAARFNKTYNSTNKTFLNAINSAYLRMLVVGTMDDPTDLETFVAIDTISYDHVWSVLKESNLSQDSLDANNSYWQEYNLELKNYKGGEYIAILAPKPTGTSYFYIDDLSIIDAETCTEISSITVNDITKTAATVNWSIPKGVENFYLEVSTDEEFEDTTKFILQDTLQALTYQLSDLKPATKYFARVKHICSELQQSEFSRIVSFTTLYTIRFNEQFEAERSIPENWALYNYADIKPTNTNSWERKSSQGDDNMYGAYMSSSISGSWKRWLETPQIDLTDVAAADSIALSFDLTTTNKDLALEDSVFFLVMVSTDGGLTYPEENRTVWGTTVDCDYPFSAISNLKKGTRWHIDMSKYNGQVIRIMFGTDVTKLQGSTGSIYLDNVQLNYYTAEIYAESVCEWTEFEDDNFTIDAKNLKVNQTTTYQKFTQADKNGEKDKLARMDLTVTGMTETIFEETLCEGETYMLNDFEITEPKSGVYRRKLQGTNTCDSVATLNLTVLSKQRQIIEQTICQGSYFEFNGVKYYTNTIKTDTLQGAASNGCDSIVTMYLTVAPILVGETEEVFLCPGTSYNFSAKYPELTEAGVYTDTIQNTLGCDSVISVDIKNVPNVQTIIRAAICEGEVYSNDVFAGLSRAGDYPSEQKTVYGCDSIVTLHLLVATPNAETQSFELYDTISSDLLPYVINGIELVQAGAERGVYTRDITLGCGKATIVISVDNADGVDNAYINTLAITPNTVAVGEPVHVLGKFAGAEVEVITATGAVAYTERNINGSIVLPGMPAAGIYLVRLTDKTGTYHGKLVVK